MYIWFPSILASSITLVYWLKCIFFLVYNPFIWWYSHSPTKNLILGKEWADSWQVKRKIFLWKVKLSFWRNSEKSHLAKSTWNLWKYVCPDSRYNPPAKHFWSLIFFKLGFLLLKNVLLIWQNGICLQRQYLTILINWL